MDSAFVMHFEFVSVIVNLVLNSSWEVELEATTVMKSEPGSCMHELSSDMHCSRLLLDADPSEFASLLV